MNEVSCKDCVNGTRSPKTDVVDSLNVKFNGYWCRAFRSVVHDYFCECKLFAQKSEVQDTSTASKEAKPE